jgi:hypothetical protein
MANNRSPELLRKLLGSETIVDLPRIESALGGVSTMTAFRYLRQVPYRRSYNLNGRYYCLHEPSRYDRFGLWSRNNIHFSVDGSLGKTVRRLVYEMEAGATHRELQERLRVRVHNTLLTLHRQGKIARERIAQVYVYLHHDPVTRKNQIERRQAQNRRMWYVIYAGIHHRLLWPRLVVSLSVMSSIASAKKGAPRTAERAAPARTTCGLVGSGNCSGHGQCRRVYSLYRVCRGGRRMPGLRQPVTDPKEQKTQSHHVAGGRIHCQRGTQDVYRQCQPSGYVFG